jgi:hypothetical protein
MQIFWLNGGLHAEAETPEEGDALNLLYNAAKRTTITEINRLEREKSAARMRLSKEGTDLPRLNPEILIVETVPGDLLNDQAIVGTQESL